MSQVHLKTSLGEIGVFTLQVRGVPILVGADMCERWGVLLSYARKTVVLEYVPGAPTVKLVRTANGHRMINLSFEPLWLAPPPR